MLNDDSTEERLQCKFGGEGGGDASTIILRGNLRFLGCRFHCDGYLVFMLQILQVY